MGARAIFSNLNGRKQREGGGKGDLKRVDTPIPSWLLEERYYARLAGRKGGGWCDVGKASNIWREGGENYCAWTHLCGVMGKEASVVWMDGAGSY